MKRFKKELIGILTISFSTILCMPVFAAGWTKGVSKDAWWYDLGNGGYHKSSWQWIDGNSDGIAECYLFDADGWMYENTKTPDGYDVNKDGAWTVSGVVQTKKLDSVNSNISKNNYQSTANKNNSTSSSNKSKTRISRILTQEDDGYYFVSTYSDGSVERVPTEVLPYEEQVRQTSEKLIDEKENFKDEVINLVNEERSKRGISELSTDSTLSEIADIRAEEITKKFSHTRPDGTLYYSLYEEYGLEGSTSGENIHFGSLTPEGAVKSWMASPGHKKNILNSNYEYIGVGVSAKDDFYCWVQVFYAQ